MKPVSRLLILPPKNTGDAPWWVLLLLSPFLLAAIVFSIVLEGCAALLNKVTGDESVFEGMEKRSGESICTFTRQLDYRNLDPVVIRAVYEEIRTAYGWLEEYGPFPLRATDRIFDELCIDGDDISFNMLPAISHRAQRSLETNMVPDPLISYTAGELVTYLSAQPHLS